MFYQKYHGKTKPKQHPSKTEKAYMLPRLCSDMQHYLTVFTGTKNLEVERKVERNKEVTAHKFWKLKKKKRKIALYCAHKRISILLQN